MPVAMFGKSPRPEVPFPEFTPGSYWFAAHDGGQVTLQLSPQCQSVKGNWVRSKAGGLLIDAVLRRPEGAAIHQPRATPWEPVISREASPVRA
jgi:hypothetical protein